MTVKKLLFAQTKEN